MIAFIEILRAIATMLIANSHFKGIYPSDVLAFGGGCGLALFYMITGYLLANINQQTHFFIWYLKKVIRMYVPLLLFRVVEIGSGFIELNSLNSALMYLIFPASWFVASMVIIYPLYFMFKKYVYLKYGEIALKIGLGLTAGAFLLLFVTKPPIATFSLQSLSIEPKFSIETPYLITQFVWVFCMLLGLHIRRICKIKSGRKSTINLILLSIACMVMFLGVRLLTAHGFSVNIEILLAPAYSGFAYFLFQFIMEYEEKCKKFLSTIPGKVVGIISMCSLEIYYVQFIWINAFKSLAFPVNLVLLVIAIVITGWCLHKLSSPICRLFLSVCPREPCGMLRNINNKN